MTHMREWLKKYDNGEPEASIAKVAHRDVRTIRRGVEQARRERDMALARAELLKQALQGHQELLVGVLRTLQLQAVVPSPDAEARYRLNEYRRPLVFSGVTCTYDTAEGWNVHLQVEDSTGWKLLQEHLRGDRLWKALRAWKDDLSSHVEARAELKEKTGKLLVEHTGLPIAAKPDELPCLTDMAGHSIYGLALRSIAGIRDDVERTVVADDATGEVAVGGLTIARTERNARQCRETILRAFRELQVSPEALKTTHTLKALKESTAKTARCLEEIMLLGLVPGQCRVCRRLGM